MHSAGGVADSTDGEGAGLTSLSVDGSKLTHGLLLAGNPLELASLRPTGWRARQFFTARDDPDRTREPWQAPAFVLEPLAAECRACTRADELPLPRSSDFCGRSSFARVVHGVLNEEQCRALLAAVNKKGFTPALVKVGGGNQMLLPESRDGHRAIVDSPELAGWLLEMLAPHLPAKVGRWELVDLNERLRFLCFTPGQEFPPHVDGQYACSNDHPGAGAVSKVTVQLYLHSVPEVHGGATTFFPGTDSALACQPMAGSVLLFTQDLEHEGSLLREGLKYTLRTDAMYRRS